MKKLIALLGVLLFAVSASAQIAVRTVPNYQESAFIFGTAAAGDTVYTASPDSITWGSAFPITKIEGVVSVFVKADTIGCGSPDSCLTIWLRIKDKNLGWSGRYSGDTYAYTRLDTIARSIVNASPLTQMARRIELSDFAAWAPGDSAQVGFSVGNMDTVLIQATKQGF